MEFDAQEKQIIRNAIALRSKSLNDDNVGLSANDAILTYINNTFLKLTSFQKAYLRGCIKEYSISQNEKLLLLTDYEVFKSKIELHKTFEFIDLGLSVLKKLKDNQYGNYRQFRLVNEKTETFKEIKTIYYSLSSNKIYKVGVVLKGKQGFKIEIGSADFSEFEIVDLFRDQFMFEGTPAEILNKIKLYENEGRPEENHKRLVEILTPAVTKYAYS